MNGFNPAHLHLVFNHLPPVGAFFGVCLLLFAMIRKSDELTRVGLGFFFFVALLALPAYFSGEPAEEAVVGLAGVSQELIEQHEEAAKTSLVAVEALGLLALWGLIAWRQQPIPKWFVVGSFILSILIGGMLGWTADLGGQIRHPEIRTRTLQPPDQEGVATSLPEEADEASERSD